MTSRIERLDTNRDVDGSMDEFEIEALLRSYRPVGPSDDLRHRILGERGSGRLWPWAAAAVALIATTLALRVGTHAETASAELHPAPEPSIRLAESLVERLGGDETARRLGEFILAEQTASGVRTLESPGMGTLLREGVQ